MDVDPASRLFSRSSLTAVAMSRTTCPEHILWTDSLSMALIAFPDAIPIRIGRSVCVMRECSKSKKTEGGRKKERVRPNKVIQPCSGTIPSVVKDYVRQQKATFSLFVNVSVSVRV